MKNKKALSSIVSTLLLVLFALVAVGVLWLAVGNILKPETILSPQKCIDLQNYNPWKIQKACYDSASKEVILTLAKSPIYNTELTSLGFVIDSNTFSCSNSCSNCKLPTPTQQTKNYFFHFQDKPQEVSYTINNCFVEKKIIGDC